MPLKSFITSTVLAIAAGLAATTAARAAPVGDIFYIAMENQNWAQPSSSCAGCPGLPILGNPAAPYINSLVTPGNPNAANVSYASNYTNVPPQLAGSPSGAGPVHPSEPNYVWAEAGLAGPRNDNSPYPSNIVNAPNFSAQLQNSGLTWRSYQEGTDLATTGGPVNGTNLTKTVLPKSQYTVPLQSFSGTSANYTNIYNGSHQYNYAAKHNPQVFFTATNGGNNTTSTNPLSQNYAPLEQLATDLTNHTVAKYNWITPDQYNDMHSTLSGGFTYHGTAYTGNQANIAQGDNFLSILVPLIEASAAFQNNGEIVIWNDETEGDVNAGTTTGFTAMEIVISPLAKGNAYTNTISYTHSSDLITNQGFTGEPCLADSCNATPLTDLFVAGTNFSVPEPASMAALGVGLVGLRIVRRRRAR